MHHHLLRLFSVWIVLSSLAPAQLNAQGTPVPDTRYIPEKAIAGVLVRPSAILQNAEIQKLYKLAQSSPRALPEQELGVSLTEIDLAVVGLTMPDAPLKFGGMGIPTIMLRTKDAAAMQIISAKAVRSDMQKKTLPGTTTEGHVAAKPQLELGGIFAATKPISGQEYERMEAEAAEAAKSPDAWKISDVFVFPDARTLLYSQHGSVMVNILDQLKSGAAAPAWAKTFDSAARFPIAAFVDVKQARELIKAATGGRAPEGPDAMVFNMVSPLWEKADLAVVALDTGDGLKLTIVANSPDAAAAQALKGSLDGLVAMGKGFLPVIKGQSAQLDALQPGLGTQLYGDLEKAVSELSVTQNGTLTILKFGLSQQTLATITGAILPALGKAQESARLAQGINNLKQIAISLHNYHDTYKHFPTPAKMKKDGNPPHSWRIAILPFIDEMQLYKQYKFDEPWDSDANKKVLAQMPAAYRAPFADPNGTNTSYVMPVIENGIFTAETVLKGPGVATVKDGLSQTIAVIETETSIPWTKPEDLVIDAIKPLPALGFAKSPTLNVAFADGAVYRFIKNPTIEALLPFLTASAGDTGDMSKLMAPSMGMAPPARDSRNEVARPVPGASEIQDQIDKEKAAP